MKDRVLGLLFILVFYGCSCPSNRPETAGAGDRPAESRAAVAQNFTYIEGVVDSVLIVDELRFQLAIRVLTARPGSAKESLAEPGQELVVTPDTAAAGQEQLSRFRSARKGDRFSGSIARSSDGRWILVNAETR